MAIEERIQSYLGNGGLFNPEMMEHDKVRDLILACRDEIAALRAVLRGAADQIESAGDDNPDHWATDESRKATIKEWAAGVRAAAN